MPFINYIYQETYMIFGIQIFNIFGKKTHIKENYVNIIIFSGDFSTYFHSEAVVGEVDEEIDSRIDLSSSRRGEPPTVENPRECCLMNFTLW